MSEIVQCCIVINRKLQQVGMVNWKQLFLTIVSVSISLLLSGNRAIFVKIIYSSLNSHSSELS